ncbi:putative endonuclease/exonuclease/phosphatase family protein [Vairimorpha necatrix]|uniref:Endonuclease/exonuclease/phosphatase family protein n=1 Tax=Vairimorpha necatrix TaxID=6039 RepID=A0AAX4JAU6_9MICR
MILVLLIGNAFSFIISKYDPNLLSGQKEISGFLKDHSKTVDVKSFGDISIITYNMEKKTHFNSNEQTNDLIKLIDNTHVPILCLQEVDEDQLKDLRSRILPHYGIVEGETSKVISPTNGNTTFDPILYDTEELRVLNSGVFKTNDTLVKNAFASWALFKMIKKDIEFIVININLYSTKSLVDSLELSSILYDINNTEAIKNKVIIMGGTINALSDNTKTLLNKKFVKLSNFNKSENESKNTMNTYMDVRNNTERDYIVALNTSTMKVQPVYSAVLRKFKNGARFPVHSIANLASN